MRAFVILSVIALSALGAEAQVGGQGQWTWDRPLPDPVPYHVDTGLLSNDSATQRIQHTEVIRLDGADWIRLYFGDVQLDSSSFLRITSDYDGEVQELDAAALEMWSNTTAYFNGDIVTVELVAEPNSQNRLEINEVAWEDLIQLPTAG